MSCNPAKQKGNNQSNVSSKITGLTEGLYAEIETSKGNITTKLFFEKTPLTVANFVSLAEGTNTHVSTKYKGKKFYDGVKFHRVIKDFMIQTGDPLGTGTGDPGYKFYDETLPELQHDKKGVLSMANSGKNTNGSQFFITLVKTPWLNGKHTVFGEVVKGLDVVDSIGTTEVIDRSKPKEDILINKVNILRVGQKAKDFDAISVFDDAISVFDKEQATKKAKMSSVYQATKEAFEKQHSKAKKLPSGLEILFTKENKSIKKPLQSSKTFVEVNYEGYFTDGKLFDTNKEDIAIKFDKFDARRAAAKAYAPMPVPYSPEAQMIPGFKEGIQQMRVGEEAILYIPSQLGYGEKGAGAIIPPNTDLIFRVEILGEVDPTKRK